MTRMPIATSWQARRAALMRRVDNWIDNGSVPVRIGFSCFLVGLPVFFALNVLIFWFTPGLPLWGACAFAVGTSAAVGAMNGLFAKVTLNNDH